jgi:hypothetical protein
MHKAFGSFIKDQRFVFFTCILLISINCNPFFYLEPPFCSMFDVGAYLSRFEDVTQDLKQNCAGGRTSQRELGYIADEEKTRNSLRSSDSSEELDLQAFRRFFIAQYALSPHILVHRLTDEKLLLGNFNNRQNGLTAAQKNNLKLLKDYGRGVFLFETRQ